MDLLNEARSYTLLYRKVIDRKPYFPLLEDEVALTVPFRPVPTDGAIRIYHISDAHSLVKEPVAAGRYFGDAPDLLVLNGDVANHCAYSEYLGVALAIAAGITRGQCPTVYARGNHEPRGVYAEDLAQYTPTANGKSYYTFRVGSVWGMVLDCGEDKNDDHEEYGGTVCFHAFRLAETDFLRKVIANADREYAAPGVKHRLVISHVPFTYRHPNPIFDIEAELFEEWARLLREEVKPELLLYGDLHVVEISPVGSRFDHRGQPCTAIFGSRPTRVKDGAPADTFIGCAVTLRDDGTEVVFNDHTGAVLRKETLPRE
jgi:hypothetical protein